MAELANYSTEILGFLFLIGILAGFVDTLAGGGGLLSLPALLISGVPPIFALGTNKLQGSFGTCVATLILFKKKKLRWKEIKKIVIASFVGSALGSIVVQFINTEILSIIVPFVLGFIALYFLFPSEVKNKKPWGSSRSYQNIVVPSIGCYDGMFGPGTGSFFVATSVLFKGLDIIKSAILAKPLNFASNIGSLVVFISFGKLFWLIGLIMICGQVIGASIGANYLVKANPRVIRLLIVAMSLGMLARYAFTNGWFA